MYSISPVKTAELRTKSSCSCEPLQVGDLWTSSLANEESGWIFYTVSFWLESLVISYSMGRDLNKVTLCKKNYWRIITPALPFPCRRPVIFNSNSRVRSFITRQATASPSPPFLAPLEVQTLQHHPACALQASSSGKWSFPQAWWVTSTWFYLVVLCKRKKQTKNETRGPHRVQKCAFFFPPCIPPSSNAQHSALTFPSQASCLPSWINIMTICSHY